MTSDTFVKLQLYFSTLDLSNNFGILDAGLGWGSAPFELETKSHFQVDVIV
jgi:hypothetical protein